MTESKAARAVTIAREVWDLLDASGHELTLVGGGVIAGAPLYYCEKCAALILVSYKLELFHGGPGAEPGKCPGGPMRGQTDTLKRKIEVLQDEEWEKLKNV